MLIINNIVHYIVVALMFCKLYRLCTSRNLILNIGKTLCTMSGQEPTLLTFCEIERKFHVPSDYHDRLEQVGFTLTKIHKSIVDIYYDFANSNENSGMSILTYYY